MIEWTCRCGFSFKVKTVSEAIGIDVAHGKLCPENDSPEDGTVPPPDASNPQQPPNGESQ